MHKGRLASWLLGTTAWLVAGPAAAEVITDGSLGARVTLSGKEVEVEDWDMAALSREVSRVFGLEAQAVDALDLATKNSDEIADALWALVKKSYEEKEQLVGVDLLRRVERDIGFAL